MEFTGSNNRKGDIGTGQEIMIKHIRKLLSKIVVAITIACAPVVAFSATNIPGGTMGDIGEYGSWATEANRDMFVKSLVGEDGDLVQFQSEFQKQLVRDYVPIEARVGIAMMNALTGVAHILDTSLVRFMIIFIIVMYAFWIMLEAYNMMTTDANVQKLIKEIFKKTIWLIIWIVVLDFGPAKLFMFVVGPIISLGTVIADFILNAIAQTAGIAIPDTCGAIHQFAAANAPADMIIDANAAANLMCLPSRLSGFFVTAISAGWQWMIHGIGHSAFTFIMGAIFVVVFAWNAWKFALMALSVIMNLFLGVILLPFTALAETIPQTSYKGIVGNIFNSFIGVFNGGPIKLDAQINKFINAAIYFVSLSIVIAVCAGLLSGVVHTNMAADVPTLTNDGFIPTLLTGALVAWLANKAGTIASDIGGKIPDGDTGKKFTDDVTGLIKKTYNSAKSWAKTIAEEKK